MLSKPQQLSRRQQQPLTRSFKHEGPGVLLLQLPGQLLPGSAGVIGFIKGSAPALASLQPFRVSIQSSRVTLLVCSPLPPAGWSSQAALWLSWQGSTGRTSVLPRHPMQQR